MSNKRKCSATPPREDVSRKKRLCDIPNTSAGKTPINSTTSPPAQPFLGRQKRPIRWRRGHNAKEPDPSPQTNIDQLPKPHKRESNGNHEQKSLLDDDDLSKQQSQLRFSFSGPAKLEPGLQQQNQSLDQSFSELNMVNTKPALPTPKASRSNSTADEVKEESLEGENRFIPELRKPGRKREGYGFSYTDTFFLDSDEYPDTENDDTENDDQATEPSSTPTTSFIHAATHHTPTNNATNPRPLSQTSTLVPSDTERSFTDLLVLHDIPLSPLAPSRLPCTPATLTQTLLLKSQARLLLSKYRESSDMQSTLLARLERMVLAEQAAHNGDEVMGALAVRGCAVRMRDFLRRVGEERVRMGELESVVEHEEEWVGWMVRAARAGVLHVRVEGCKCRPDWGE
ncbi:hypothetical protein IQ07DRAFT_679291 [Pyrenochaeta sp. DS3sAY3a]|nr:hypothetical protein IQ07DRAFT_679291 [Pyrenochaeta sp. DS3sAY3a]